MTILSGWQEQYDRMVRSLSHLEALATGEVHALSNENRDALIHFFQDAYHLKDWIKNDDTIDQAIRVAVERYISDTPMLSICADLCNGTKHFRLTSASGR